MILVAKAYVGLRTAKYSLDLSFCEGLSNTECCRWQRTEDCNNSWKCHALFTQPGYKKIVCRHVRIGHCQDALSQRREDGRPNRQDGLKAATARLLPRSMLAFWVCYGCRPRPPAAGMG